MRIGEQLPREFYSRRADEVALKLIGKLLIKEEREGIGGMIVETEAYLGKEDPASIAYEERRRNLAKRLYGEPGEIFIYMVHGNWLLNILVDEKDIPAAVLIRAIEPIYGVETMEKRRRVKRIWDISNGPGKLTKALNIDERYNGYNVSSPESPIKTYRYKDIEEGRIGRSHRIGVTMDTDIQLRFYITGNKWVSRHVYRKRR
jgi:DNA-3-methyladenine glycosylase